MLGGIEKEFVGWDGRDLGMFIFFRERVSIERMIGNLGDRKDD